MRSCLVAKPRKRSGAPRMEPTHSQSPPTVGGTSTLATGLPPRTSDDPPISVEVLEPGLVHIKHALGRDAQLALAEVAMARGNHPTDGFWRPPTEDGAPRVLNCSVSMSRGRVFDAVGRFPASFVEACGAAVRTARAADPHMPAMDPTHLLMVYYESGRGIFWHKDNARNDGRNDHPVVSFSLGNRCSFSVQHNWSWGDNPRKGVKRTIILESGDALLFGGACRYIHHSVTGVKRNTAPPWLPMLKDKRLNLTFRDAPEVAGEEHSTYKYFTPSEGKKKTKKRLRVEDVGAGPSSQETVADE